MVWIQSHWVEVVGAVWAFDQLLKIIAGMTKTKIDDNFADMLGSLLSKFFPHK